MIHRPAFRNAMLIGSTVYWTYWTIPLVLSAQNIVRNDAPIVVLDVEVKEEGHLLTGLTNQDFVVLDERNKQLISEVSSISMKIDLLLLLDHSGSIAPISEQIVRTVMVAKSSLKPGDRIAIMTFNARAKPVLAFTENLDLVDLAMERLSREPFGGGTKLYASLGDAAKYLTGLRHTEVQTPNPRQTVVLMATDGIGKRAIQGERLIGELLEAHAIMDVILIGPNSQQIARLQRPIRYEPEDAVRLAAQTGGSTMTIKHLNRESMAALLEGRRSGYRILYRKPEPKVQSAMFLNAHCDLSVEARKQHPNAIVYASRGITEDK